MTWIAQIAKALELFKENTVQLVLIVLASLLGLSLFFLYRLASKAIEKRK